MTSNDSARGSTALGLEIPLLRRAFWAFGMFLALQLALWAMGAKARGMANVWWWSALSTLAAERGFFNVWTPYPPIFTVVHYALTQAFGADPALLSRYFFEGDRTAEAVAAYEATFATMKVVWVVLNGVFLSGQAWLIYRLAQWRLSAKEAALTAGAFCLFNLSWQSQIVIGLWCDQFDYFPSFFFLLGVFLLSQGLWRGSALVAAIGAMVKIYPGLLVPLAWAHLHQSRRATAYTMLVVGLCLAIAAPFLFVNAETFLASFKWSGSRPGWESVWIYPEQKFPPMPVPPAMIGLFDSPVPEALVILKDGRQFLGRVNSEGSDHILFDLLNEEQVQINRTDIQAVRSLMATESKYQLLMVVTLVALLASAWAFRESLRQSEGLLRGALLFVLILVFFSKGVSSYFILWFFPFLFILYRPLVACGLFSVFLLVGNLEFAFAVERPGFPTEFPCYWGSIFLRQALFLGLAIDQMRKMRSVSGA